MSTKVEFELPIEEEGILVMIVERFLEYYPNATHTTTTNEEEETCMVSFTSDEFKTVDDVDTFACEEICHEFEAYCFINDGDNNLSYYYDEDDEWT